MKKRNQYTGKCKIDSCTAQCFAIAIVIVMTYIFIVTLSKASSAQPMTYNAIEMPTWTYEVRSDYPFHKVAISSDGKYIVASQNDVVFFFGGGNNTPQWHYTNPNGYIGSAVAISDNGAHIIVGGASRIRLFNKNSSEPLWSYSNNCTIHSVAISSDGKYAVAGGEFSLLGPYADRDLIGCGWLYFFDMNKNEPLWEYIFHKEPGGKVTSVSISGDGKYIAVGRMYAGKIYLFHSESIMPIWSYLTDRWIEDVVISHDGNYIAASTSNTINLFEKSSNSTLWTYTTTNNVTSISLSGDGEYLTATDDEGVVYLFNRNSGIPIWTYHIKSSSSTIASISRDGQYIVVGDEYNRLCFFNTMKNTPLWERDIDGPITSLSISKNGKRFVAGAGTYLQYSLQFFSNDYGINLYSSDKSKIVAPGGKVLYEIYVINYEDIEDNVTFVISGVPPTWNATLRKNSFTIEHIRVPPKTSINITLVVTTSFTGDSNRAIIYVRGESQTNSSNFDTLTIFTNVNPYIDIVSSHVSKRVKPSCSTTYIVEVTNYQSYKDNITFTISELPSNWNATLSQNSKPVKTISLEPYTLTNLTLTITAPFDVIDNEQMLFYVKAKSETNASNSDTLTFSTIVDIEEDTLENGLHFDFLIISVVVGIIVAVTAIGIILVKRVSIRRSK